LITLTREAAFLQVGKNRDALTEHLSGDYKRRRKAKVSCAISKNHGTTPSRCLVGCRRTYNSSALGEKG